MFRRVIASLVSLGPGENTQECGIAVCHPMTEYKSADEYGDSRENRIEEVECTNGANADEVKQRAFNSQVGEGLVQALEDPIAPRFVVI